MTSGIHSVAVIGAGTMGEGIAQNFAEAGLAVRLIDSDPQAIDRCLGRIMGNLGQSQGARLIEEPPSTIISRIRALPASDLLSATSGCELIVETVPELLDLKRDIFKRLDSAPAGTILASNTGSLTISAIAEGMKTPQRVVGTHYFNPAHIIPAVEIHRGKLTSQEAVETVSALLEHTGKVPVIVRKEAPGFIINRLTGALEREVDYLLDHGITTPEDIDRAVKASIGFRLACLGPMEAEDFIGLDTAARASANIFKTLSNATEPSPGLLDKVARIELGVKSGKGWYDYAGRTREQVLADRNNKLLKQLALFMEANRPKND